MNSTLTDPIDITDAEAQAVIEYIDTYIAAYMNEEFNIMCVELYNGEKVLCMYDLDDPTLLYMPIHLIENINTDDYVYKISYLLYPYHNLASECSELILDEPPKVIFAPKSLLLFRYMEYWNELKDAYSNILTNQLEDESDNNYIEAETLMVS